MNDIQIALKAVQAYAELCPRPLHVTQKQAAEMLWLSVPTVRKMVASVRNLWGVKLFITHRTEPKLYV